MTGALPWGSWSTQVHDISRERAEEQQRIEDEDAELTRLEEQYGSLCPMCDGEGDLDGDQDCPACHGEGA